MQFTYGRQSIDEEDIRAVVEVMHGDFLTQGPKVQEFEYALCDYTGAKYAVCVCNGTAALHLACLAAGISKGDEVIVPAISFAATANSVVFCGGTPIFCDIDANSINIDSDAIESKITKSTKAILPVHFAGFPCDLEKISSIAKKHNLALIEDAAHALGSSYQNGKTGNCHFSDMTIFSFHPVKAITTAEGGAILTNNKEFYQKLRLLRTHGITKDPDLFIEKNEERLGPWYYEMQQLGYNYRISDIQCALGISQLKKLDRFIEKRKKIADLYDKAFKDSPFIQCPKIQKNNDSSYHLYHIVLDKSIDRKRTVYRLHEKGIGVQVHYMPIHLHPFYRKQFGYKDGDMPIAENYYSRCMSLPIYPDLTISDAHEIAQIVKTEIEQSLS